MTISGRIEGKNVKSGTYGDLVIFKVGGKSLSVFANDKKLTQEAKDLIRELSQGDEAEFTTYETTGKDGKTYTNISGVVKVTRLGGDTGEEMDYGVKHPSQPESHKPKESRDEMMRMSYCKDIMIAFPNEGEIDLLGRVEIVKKMAKLMGE